MDRICIKDYYQSTISISKSFFATTSSAYCEALISLSKKADQSGGVGIEHSKEVIQQLANVYANIPLLGKHLVESLTLWQENGATVQELCELAGANYKKLKHRIPANADFVDIIRKYQFDFKDAGKRTPTWTDNAPLTLAVLAADDISQIRIGRNSNA